MDESHHSAAGYAIYAHLHAVPHLYRLRYRHSIPFPLKICPLLLGTAGPPHLICGSLGPMPDSSHQTARISIESAVFPKFTVVIYQWTDRPTADRHINDYMELDRYTPCQCTTPCLYEQVEFITSSYKYNQYSVSGCIHVGTKLLPHLSVGLSVGLSVCMEL